MLRSSGQWPHERIGTRRSLESPPSFKIWEQGKYSRPSEHRNARGHEAQRPRSLSVRIFLGVGVAYTRPNARRALRMNGRRELRNTLCASSEAHLRTIALIPVRWQLI